MKRFSLLSLEGVEKAKTTLEVSLGKGEADMAVVNGTIFNVYTGEWLDNLTVLTKGEWVAYVGPHLQDAIGPKTYVLDAQGKVVVPGFMEAHTHLADAMYYPMEFLRLAMTGGTTTIVTETIELFPVGGADAIIDFLDAFKDQPIKVFATATPIASTSTLCHGIGEEALKRLLQRDDVIGLGEAFWQAVLQDPGTFLPRFEETLLSGRRVEGHSAGAKGRNLSAFVTSGVTSCHEPVTSEEALERLRLGMYVMIREGSIRGDLNILHDLMAAGIDHKHLMLVTDGVRPIDLVKNGYMEHVVQKAIDRGIDPGKAIQMVTVNVADYFGLDGIAGGIAPGRHADFLILPDRVTIKPEVVVSKGKVIAREGTLLIQPRNHAFSQKSLNSVHLPRPMLPEDFAIHVDSGSSHVRVRVIDQITELVTKEVILPVPVVNGEIRIDPEKDLLKVAAVERRFVPGKTFVALIRGFGLKNGAIGCSEAWDTSDIIVVGQNETDMAAVVNRIHELQGGMVLCAGGRVLAEIPLPILGLMSDMPVEELATRLEEMKRQLKGLGFRFEDPHRTLVPLTGAAIPFVRLSEQGLWDIKNGKRIPFLVDGMPQHRET